MKSFTKDLLQFLYLLSRNQQTAAAPSKVLGITSPLSMMEPKQFDLDLSVKLKDAMLPYGVFESEEELNKR